MLENIIETASGFETAENVTLGVISDTHVPDWVDRLHPKTIGIFKEAKVDAILHAGDICSPEVISQLERVAPVFAVRGNRDIYLLSKLPRVRLLTFAGHRIALVHGHGRWNHYLINWSLIHIALIKPL